MRRATLLAMALIGCVFVASTTEYIFRNKKARMVAVKLEKEFALGERSDGKEALFQSVRSFRVDNKGNIYVLDYKAPKLLKISDSGELIFSVGRKGQGPGEFMAPSRIELGKNNSILIYDVGNRRLTHFSAVTGELLAEKSTAKWPRLISIDEDSKGFFYGYQTLYEPRNTVRVISKFSPELDLVKEVFRLEVKPLGKEVEIFSPRLLFRVLEDDRLLAANSAVYDFYWYSPEGNLVRTVNNTYERIPITEADKKREIEVFTEGAPAPRDQVFVFPDNYPPIDSMITDDKDNIFVRRYENDKAGNHIYEAFNKEGESLGKFPLGFTVFCIVGDRMYSLEADEGGFDCICRYRYKIIKK